MGEGMGLSTEDRHVHGQSYEAADDDRSSLSSDAQIGVKNIEAISRTWTQRSLPLERLALMTECNVQGIDRAHQ
ncbi:MAG: hypothetical protein Q9193_001808 [Seirophora villosa]